MILGVSLVALIIGLVIGGLVYLIVTKIIGLFPIPEDWKGMVNLLVLVLVLLWVLSYAGFTIPGIRP